MAEATYTVWHCHAHVIEKDGRGPAWYPRHVGLTLDEAHRMPMPVLGLCKILPDGQVPDGDVRLRQEAFMIEKNDALPKNVVSIRSGANYVFADVDRGVIVCPDCQCGTFRANISGGRAVLSCTQCGSELGCGT